MPEIILRMGLLILMSLVLSFLVWSGRRFVEIQRKRAFAAPPLDELVGSRDEGGHPNAHLVHILAFSSADCKQCHQLQTPTLRHVQEVSGDTVAVVEVDASASPELVQRYHVLTVPTTVVLDTSGRVHAVNYGFANTQRLLEQVNAVLVQM
jgi:Thioredoxin